MTTAPPSPPAASVQVATIDMRQFHNFKELRVITDEGSLLLIPFTDGKQAYQIRVVRPDGGYGILTMSPVTSVYPQRKKK